MNGFNDYSVNEGRVGKCVYRYKYRQPAHPLELKEYLISNFSDRRCCLLRWKKMIDKPIKSIELDFSTLDAEGELIDTRRILITEKDIPNALGRRDFATEKAIPVSDACADVRIRLIEVLADNYVYTVSGKQVDTHYEIPQRWVYDDQSIKAYSNMGRVISSKRRVKVRLARLAAVISVIMLAVWSFSPYLIRWLKLDWLTSYFG